MSYNVYIGILQYHIFSEYCIGIALGIAFLDICSKTNAYDFT